MKNGKKQPVIGSMNVLSAFIKSHETYLAGHIPETKKNVFTIARLQKIVCAAARKTPKILQCTSDSLIFCVAQACALGLEPGGAMDHVYFVPRQNKHTGATECTVIVSYKGIMELARRSGELKNIEAHVVYEHDYIEVVWGTSTQVVHRPCLKGPRGRIIGAHCRADFTNGGSHYEYMTRDDLEHVRQSSQGNVWDKHYAEMARKSVVRRAAKYWPQSAEVMDALSVDGTAAEDEGPEVYDVVAEVDETSNNSSMGDAMANVESQITSIARQPEGQA